MNRFFGQRLAQRWQMPTARELRNLGQPRWHGDFELTGACLPDTWCLLNVALGQGYRYDEHVVTTDGRSEPCLVAAVTKEELFPTFLDLLDYFGAQVHVVLETTHERRNSGHRDFIREYIGLPDLLEALADYELILCEDGYTCIAVADVEEPVEVLFDKHKLLVVYGRDFKWFEHALKKHGIHFDDDLTLITDVRHLHTTREEFRAQFHELRKRIGAENTSLFGHS